MRAVSLHALGDATLASAGFIERVSEVDKPLREIGAAFSVPGATGRLRNASALFCDLHHGLESALGVGTIGQWRAVAEALAGERVPGGLGAWGRWGPRATVAASDGGREGRFITIKYNLMQTKFIDSYYQVLMAFLT